MNKYPFLLCLLSAIAALVATGLLFSEKSKLHEQQLLLQRSQVNLKAAKEELALTSEQLSQLKLQLETEQNHRVVHEQQLESVRSELFIARQETTRKQQERSTQAAQVKQLEHQLNAVRTQLIGSERTLKASSQEGKIAQLTERVNELESANLLLTAKLKSATDSENERP